MSKSECGTPLFVCENLFKINHNFDHDITLNDLKTLLL